ncbi:MAG: hypothetical protein GX275_05880 [Clostridiales bacterium]|nr:hypothetical protein [Clostridiales bacterium]
MNYVVIDFETANANRSSACSIGIIEVENDIITKENEFLINPEEDFDGFNIAINGITPEMVKDKPNFKKLWSFIKPMLENKIVIAHNAAFDMSVLRHTLDKYNIPYPTFTYSCTRILSKKTWPELINYKLDTVAKYLGIEFTHHKACEDAKATAIIFSNILKINNTNSFEDLHQQLRVNPGESLPNTYSPACVKHSSRTFKISNLHPDLNSIDESHEFFNKGIAFTGTLTSMPRKDAAQLAINKGAIYCNSITKKTNYLVIGIQDYSRFIDGEKSSKLKKAEALIKEGQDLEIIAEDDFLKII